MRTEFDPEIQRYLNSLLDAEDGGPAAEGRIINGWRIGARIGTGGTSDVYRAVHETSGEIASVKVLREVSEVSRRRFAFECELLATARSKSLPRMIGRGEIDGRPCVITELLEPIDLPEGERAIVDYILEVCDCVSALHAAGIVHRDIKPQNVMKRSNGEIVLIDLGLAKDVGEFPFARDGISIVDGKAAGGGTPGYAAPEQFTGGEITVQTDIHGLGMLLYTCLTSCRSGNDPIPKRWQEIVHRAICTVPEERYADVGEFVAAIRDPRWRRGRTAAGAVAVLLAALVWWIVTSERTEETDRTEWTSLCRNIVTNIVSRELVWEKMTTNRVGNSLRVEPVRAYRTVTNAVKAVRISLGNGDHVFREPLLLLPDRPYYIVGPGRLEAEFRAEPKAELHLVRCMVVNRAKGSISGSGIRYILENDAYLGFAEIEEPTTADRDCIAIADGRNNELRFKGPETLRELEAVREAETDREAARERAR